MACEHTAFASLNFVRTTIEFAVKARDVNCRLQKHFPESGKHLAVNRISTEGYEIV